MPEEASLTVNGQVHTLPLTRERSLLYALREELGLTGAKYGCGEGECAACTVLVDGKPVLACKVPLREAAGKQVTTIEGLAPPGGLHPVQEAFLEMGAMQCGYCTPGMILGAAAFLEENPDPSREAIIAALDGHLCRCCTYPRIIEAVSRAAERMREAR